MLEHLLQESPCIVKIFVSSRDDQDIVCKLRNYPTLDLSSDRNSEDINTNKPLHSFGVDSLVAVEVRNWIFKELKSEVTVFDIMDPQPLTALCGKIAERSKLISNELKATGKEAE